MYASDIPTTRKSSSRMNKRPSISSLSMNTHSHNLDPDDIDIDDTISRAPSGGAGGGSGFSLAHELAFALMPEPSGTGSRLLAEELGIEYEEGAEGIDSDPSFRHSFNDHNHNDDDRDDDGIGRTHTLNDHEDDERDHHRHREEIPLDVDPAFASYDQAVDIDQPEYNESDPMQLLAQSLELTESFIRQLRSLDIDSSSSTTTTATATTATAGPSSTAASHHLLSLEAKASAIIRHIDETTRDREGQLRELLECEREFKRIAGEVGGEDVLGHLDQLDDLEPDDIDIARTSLSSHRRQSSLSTPPLTPTSPIAPTSSSTTARSSSTSTSTVQPHLSSLRSSTTSLISSLTLISEHAQVSGAATADAGRKIRALKNKIGGWRADWDLAEQSRLKIEKWQAEAAAGNVPAVSGRDAVQMHLQAFERAVADATIKTKAITVAT